MKRKPLIITGFGESGGTALTDLLNIDGRLFITNEAYQFIPEMEDSPAIYINLQWTGTIHRMVDLFERHGVSWADLFPANIRRSLFNDWLDNNLPDSIEYIGDKTPRPYMYGIQQIMDRNPGVKVIIPMRDPRDSIISSLWGQQAWPFSNAMVESWINCANIIKDYLIPTHPEKCLMVRYEQSRKNPEQTAKEIGDFLEIGDLNIEGHDFRPPKPQIWRDQYKDMTRTIEKKYPEFPGLLEVFGYE